MIPITRSSPLQSSKKPQIKISTKNVSSTSILHNLININVNSHEDFTSVDIICKNHCKSSLTLSDRSENLFKSDCEIFKVLDENQNRNFANQTDRTENGTFIATTNGKTITELEIKLEKSEFKHHYKAETILKRSVGCVKLLSNPNAKFENLYVSAGSDGVVKLWAWGDRKLKGYFDVAEYAKSNQGTNKTNVISITSITFDSSGTKLAVGYSTNIIAIFKFPSDSTPILITKLPKIPNKIIFQKNSSSLLYIYHKEDNSIHLFDFLKAGARIGFWRLGDKNQNQILSWNAEKTNEILTRKGIFRIEGMSKIEKIYEFSSVFESQSQNEAIINHGGFMKENQILLVKNNGQIEKISIQKNDTDSQNTNQITIQRKILTKKERSKMFLPKKVQSNVVNPVLRDRRGFKNQVILGGVDGSCYVLEESE